MLSTSLINKLRYASAVVTLSLLATFGYAFTNFYQADEPEENRGVPADQAEAADAPRPITIQQKNGKPESPKIEAKAPSQNTGQDVKRSDLRAKDAHANFTSGTRGKTTYEHTMDLEPDYKPITHYEVRVVPWNKPAPSSFTVKVTGDKGSLYVDVKIEGQKVTSIRSGGDFKKLGENTSMLALAEVSGREYYEFDAPETTKFVASIMVPKQLMTSTAGSTIKKIEIVTRGDPDLSILGRIRAWGPK